MTITVIDGTEKFGSSSWPSFVKPEHAADGDREDQEQNDGAVVQRPFGEVERFHRVAFFVSALRAAPGSATRKPGAIFCTPAVTTRSPAGGPDTSTSSLR